MSSSATGSPSDQAAPGRTPLTVRRIVTGLPPNAFSFLMATGILGTAFVTVGLAPIGIVLFVIATGGLLVLLAALVARVLTATTALAADLRDPSRAFGFWTVVAAFDVVVALGHALGIGWIAWLAVAVAVPVWAALTYGMLPALVLRAYRRPSAKDVDGSWFLWVVATQSVSIIASLLSAGIVAFSFWGVGVVLYFLLAGLLTARFLGTRRGPGTVAPTAWVVMGATAISALAAARIVQSGELPVVAPFVLGAGLVLWAFGTWCVPFLIVLGVVRYLVRREPIRYETGLWSVVFPLGMYATATLALATALGSPLLSGIGTAVLWIAALAWIAVAGIGAATGIRRLRR
ncbi:tellurite resistance/C4-dicarboxylate transporter family protein [Leifsonia aquatica]|uniref:Tellurite resistance protein TehA-like permease n=1 Tax=Leifsonia aquatica TaxID=144185 RepID=A0A7W4YJ22_LEIAQ|nr:tellurite resistance/C4-dicarboxylate transporter family protein [Leifsonia aquatica]MBB2967958.1 tellurite resistance protein TehA-like permease [Leifsonia aquatica]